MSLEERINYDLKEFLKSGKSFETGVLRMVFSVFQNKKIEKRGKGQAPELFDEEAVEILLREAKKRKEASEIYIRGGREDLSKKEIQELEVIKKYLPEQIGEKEVEIMVIEAIKKLSAKNEKDFGKVMAELMKELRGKADASLVSNLVKRHLLG
ncbi:MAG: GatB/YqeY domain-containing protein [Patescibacteria group bacterium]